MYYMICHILVIMICASAVGRVVSSNNARTSLPLPRLSVSVIVSSSSAAISSQVLFEERSVSHPFEDLTS